MQEVSPDRAHGRDRTGLVVLALVAVIVASWLLAMPRSAGPDEPSHLVRSAALVRGELDGRPYFEFGFSRAFVLPAHVGFPDPVCFAFAEYQPASCADELDRPPGDALLGTRAANYPIWGHVLPGLGSFAPAAGSTWASRVLDAVVPVLLVAGALVVAARRGRLAVGAVLLALTPMAWFMFAVVNPSGTTIAGGVGLWVALLAVPPRRAPVTPSGSTGSVVRHDRLLDTLLAASWAATVLPRRDGLIWASLILALALLITGDRLVDPWRRAGTVARVVVGGATVAALAWAVTSSTSDSMALFLTPAVPVLAVGLRAVWRVARDRGRTWVGGLVVAGLVLTPLALLAVMDRRAGGFDRGVLREVVRRTGDDLTEAIGVLGWLDTQMPTTSRFVWLLGLGIVVGAAVLAGARALLAGAAAIVGLAVLSSWVLTMLQDDDTGTYWQGRYYLPLLVGAPIVLGRVSLPDEMTRRAGRAVAAIGLVVGLVSLGAAIRRFGVGVAGSMLPWDWGTYDTVVPPVLLLVVAAAASAGLYATLDRLAGRTQRL